MEMGEVITKLFSFSPSLPQKKLGFSRAQEVTMNKGNSSDDCLPKFFKVYLPDDSGDDLEIPISFNTCLPNSLPRNVIVRSIYGNVWKLELGKCCGDIEKFVMVDGWKRIVKDEYLKGGEFLAFEFDGFRVFNFCIYGHATCKRLGKTKEIEGDKSGVDIIVIDDDDDDDEDDAGDGDDADNDDVGDDEDADDQDSGHEDKSSVEVIVIVDDSTDDDNDDVSGDQDSVDEDKSREDIIVIDDEDSDQDDDDDERRSGVETETKEKGSSKVSTKSDSEDDRQYLDNDMIPFFTVKNRSAHTR